MREITKEMELLDAVEDTKKLNNAIRKSQHCQRNWDIEQKISDDIIKSLKIAVTECPSKQNIAFYKVTFIQNREIIEKVHDATYGFTYRLDPSLTTTNSQVLANLLVVFEPLDLIDIIKKNNPRNTETNDQDISEQSLINLENDQKLAIGIAAGYLNLTATLLELSTGCCSCFEADKVKNILGLVREPALLMGIGYGNKAMKSRRAHHKRPDFMFPTFSKQEIDLKEVN